MKHLLVLLLGIGFTQALIIAPEEALQQSFHAEGVTKKSMILTAKEHHLVQQTAQTKLHSKLFRLYRAEKEGRIIGWGILLTQKVRSKSTAILSMLDPQGGLLAVEIIAFNEPKEYLPSQRWLQQFHDRRAEQIDAISGATLSANSVMRCVKLSQAIWKVKVKQ